ncbi:hypothetical protein [uncultured Acinetobacter sp.]|uniref:hypothetical protein n=1 Tax=uncultured Acinetobacter sp. TaxID=165433 RepID=UPI00258F8582|nr:hypothetical protein [uncultured Acinetobacter sp.]
MENYEYWVNVYSVVFSILIISLSLNSIFFIKDKINKVLSFFVFTGLYSLILSYFFEKSSIGYTQQEFLPTFIYNGYNSHIFQENIFSLIALAILIIRLLINKK